MSKSKRKLKQKIAPEAAAEKPKKERKSQEPTIDPNVPHVYKRAGWKHYVRYFAASTLFLLNVAITMSFIERMGRHHAMDPFKEIFFFGFVLFIDIFMLLPLIFETNRVETDAEGIKMTTLLWKTRVPWDKVLRFEQPQFLKFAILRTAKCFYLLNKRDLKPYFELASIIISKTSANERKEA